LMPFFLPTFHSLFLSPISETIASCNQDAAKKNETPAKVLLKIMLGFYWGKTFEMPVSRLWIFILLTGNNLARLLLFYVCECLQIS
ncbi:MAG TPA: hypothetical protein VN441_07520, partial [Syntrophomonas sp.]|nr:hypothetical protein [Syntrophomonas sp.]